jgi:hypothetical protein
VQAGLQRYSFAVGDNAAANQLMTISSIAANYGQVYQHSNTTGTSFPGLSFIDNGGGNGSEAAVSGTEQIHAQFRSTFLPASGASPFVCLDVKPTINQTGTSSGSYTALRVNVVETALKGTANKLLDLQAGVTGGTSQFSISNKGHIFAVADCAGQATITAAATTVAVTFTANYTGTAQPVIVITPTSDPLALGVPVGYWVTYSGGAGAWTGFTVNIQTALAGDVTFNYCVLGRA